MEYLISTECWGHGVYVEVCQICRASNYYGTLKHNPGCKEATLVVKEVRKPSRSGGMVDTQR